MAAFAVDPSQATEENKETMEYFLKMSLFNTDGNLKGMLAKDRSKTTVEIYGDSWPCEMATAALMIEMFSTSKNIAENAGKEKGQPRKRARLQTPEERKITQPKYYNWLGYFRKFRASTKDTFVQRMAEWDKMYLGIEPPQKASQSEVEADNSSGNSGVGFLTDFLMGTSSFGSIFSKRKEQQPSSDS